MIHLSCSLQYNNVVGIYNLSYMVCKLIRKSMNETNASLEVQFFVNVIYYDQQLLFYNGLK